jgi:DNA-damage-inducible protein D
VWPNLETNLAVFRGKEIRKTIHKNEWWFVVEDVVLALIDSSDPKQYIQRMKQRDPELGKGWVQIVHTLLIDTPGGKKGLQRENLRDHMTDLRVKDIWLSGDCSYSNM